MQNTVNHIISDIRRELETAGGEDKNLLWEKVPSIRKLLDYTEVTEEINSYHNADTLYDVVLANIARAINGGGEGDLQTGFLEIDRRFGGFMNGELIVLGARPAMGKSCFWLSLVDRIAVQRRIPVAVFSLEMSAEQITQRLVAMVTNVPTDKLRHGNLDAQEQSIVETKSTPLKNVPIYINDSPALTVFQIAQSLRKMKEERDIQFAVVDYLQLMGGGRGNRHWASRELEISQICRGFKSLAKELDIPILVVSQLSRAVETRGGDKRPILSDLRESGAIEQDADKVLFLYRAEYYGLDFDWEDKATKDIAELICSKNRNGPVSTVRLKFINRLPKFEDLDESEPDDTCYFERLKKKSSDEKFKDPPF